LVDPTLKLMEPVAPLALVPLPITTSPLFCRFVVPVDMSMKPEVPLVAASAVRKTIGPELVGDVPPPDTMLTPPP
jgi:hypothetical protein